MSTLPVDTTIGGVEREIGVEGGEKEGEAIT